jgi:hypothetical protein
MHVLISDLASDGTRPGTLRFFPSIMQLHLQSLPLLVPTIVVFAGVAWWRLEEFTSGTLAALTITFFVVVTVPHHLLVEKMAASSLNQRNARHGDRKASLLSTARPRREMPTTGLVQPPVKHQEHQCV